MISPITIKREKILFSYTSALEGGDFARLEAILEMASSDEILERQIVEINAALSQPQEVKPAQAAPETLFVKLWNQVKSFTVGLRSVPSKMRPSLRSIAVVATVMLVALVGVVALLGPALGRVFQDAYFPSELRPYAQAPAPTQPPAATQPPPGSSAGYPAPVYTPQAAGQTTGRLIVRNANLTVVAKDTRQARQAVLAMVSEFAPEGAFVVSANETYPYNDQMPAISMLLRIPVKHYDESMTRLAGLGIQVLNRVENAQDVTQNYVDITARIEALQTSRARLLEIMKDAKNIDDLLRAEQELSRREAELEAAIATRQNLEKTAALSSIALELRPAISSQPVADNTWNPADTFHNAVSIFLSNLRSLADSSIYFAITTLPWLLVIGLLIYVTVRVLRKLVKK